MNVVPTHASGFGFAPFLIAATLSLSPSQVAAQTTLEIGIGTQNTTTNTVTGGVVLKELGLLEKHLPKTGKYKDYTYKLSWQNATSGPPITNGMMANNIQIGMMGDYPLLVNGATGQATGNPTQLVAIIAYNAFGGGNGIVVHKDSPFYELADLKGKNVSVPFGSAAHGMMLQALQSRSLPNDFWNLVSQSPEVGSTNLQEKRIDAHGDFVPFAELLPFRGFARKIFDGAETKVPTFHGVVVRKDFGEKYPEIVTAYIRALMEANEWVRSSPKRAAEKIEQWTGINKEVVYIFLGPGGVHTLDPSIKKPWVDAMGVDHGVLKRLNLVKDLNIPAWVNDTYVKAAFSEIGTLITALGTGIGRDGSYAFNPDKLRYHRIIIMTDADVDGSHIRTLLLTFFFRQMPELIERGHIYIAQPPLYKASRGKSALYLKDERALEDYLIDTGIEGAVLRLESGLEMQGPQLRHLLDEGRFVRQIVANLHSRYDRTMVEQAAIAGALKPEVADDPARGPAAAASVAERLDRMADEIERGWTGELEEGGYQMKRTVRGVTQAVHLDAALLGSQEARRLDERAPQLAEIYGLPATLVRRNDETPIYGPLSLFDAVMAFGRKGITLQRYKGLGEMNADQLYETTLDRDVRSLLQVKVKDVVDAGDLFTKLMGEVVEPRREFIQENALSVANLDV